MTLLLPQLGVPIREVLGIAHRNEIANGLVVHSTSLQKQTPTMFGAGPNDIYSDAGPGSSLDLDTDRPLFNEDSSSYPGTDGKNLQMAHGYYVGCSKMY